MGRNYNVKKFIKNYFFLMIPRVKSQKFELNTSKTTFKNPMQLKKNQQIHKHISYIIVVVIFIYEDLMF